MPSADNLLEMIRSKVDSARAANQNLVTAEVDNAAKAQQITEEAAVRQELIGQSQAVVIGAQQVAQQTAQAQMQGGLAAAGGFDTLYGLIAQQTDAAKRLQGQLKVERAEVANTSIVNPLSIIARMVDWSGNQAGMRKSVEELQALGQASQVLEGRLNQVGAISQAAKETVTTASIQASTSIVEWEAQQQAAKWRLEGLKYNTAGTQAVAAASDKDLAYSLQLGNFTRQEAQYQLALEEEARRREQFDWNKEQQRAIRDEKQDAKSFEDRTIYYINLGEVSRGLTPSSAQQVRDHIKLNKGLGAEYADLYRKGEITHRNPGQAIVGFSPGESASIYSRDPSLVAVLPEQQKKIAELLQEATKVLGLKDVRVKEGLDDDKTGAKALKVVSNQVNGIVANQLRFVGNNPDNLFYIGDPTSYIGTAISPGVSAFQTYPLVQKVLNPAIAANMSLADPSTVYGLTLEAVKRGDLTTAQAAADFSNIYRRMSALHRAGMDFRKFGISLPADGATYNVRLGENRTVDATNYSAVASAMVKSLVASRFNDYRTGKVVNPGLARELQRNTQGLPNE